MLINLSIGHQYKLLNHIVKHHERFIHNFCSRNSSNIMMKNGQISSLILLKNVHQPSLIMKRQFNFSHIYKIWSVLTLKDKTAQEYFKKDRVDPIENHLIYKGETNRQATFFTLIVSATVSIALIVTYISIHFLNVDYIKPDEFDTTAHFTNKYGIILFLLMNLALNTVSRRYVLRIYLNEKTNMFTIVTWKWYNPFMTRKTICKPGSAVEAPIDFMQMFIGNVLVKVKSKYKRFVIFDQHFYRPIYYNIMFGHDKTKSMQLFKSMSDKGFK